MNMHEPMEGQPRFEVTGWIEAGFTGNFDSPNDRQNFGRLLDDRANEPLLNQLVVSAERGPDPELSEQFDWGFKAQAFYGSDARYLRSTGMLDLATNNTEQPDIPEAWVLAHFPLKGTSGGLDVKLGKFLNCFGADGIDPRTNVFYSRTHIFNFGCPFYGTGALVTFHAQPWLDLYASIDRGLNVAVEDNNDSVSFYGGVGINCCDGKLYVAALTHIGPASSSPGVGISPDRPMHPRALLPCGRKKTPRDCSPGAFLSGKPGISSPSRSRDRSKGRRHWNCAHAREPRRPCPAPKPLISKRREFENGAISVHGPVFGSPMVYYARR